MVGVAATDSSYVRMVSPLMTGAQGHKAKLVKVLVWQSRRFNERWSWSISLIAHRLVGSLSSHQMMIT